MTKADGLKKILFITSLFAICLGCCLLKNTPDNDIWARLTAGKYIIETFSVLKNDFLSYTPTHAWYDHEWGASAIFYAIFKFFGAWGLIFIRGLLVALTLFFSFLTIKERNPKNTSPYNILYYAAMLAALGTSIGATVRCLLFTSLFFAIAIYILERARNGKNKTLFLIPILMLFWENIHGGVLSLPGILLVYAIGEYLNGKDFKKYLYAFFSCIPVLFVNPYGIDYVKFLFEAGLMNRDLIWEWKSPFEAHFITKYAAYKIYLVCMLAVLFSDLRKTGLRNIDKTKYLAVVLMILLSVKSIRYISFFVFTSGTLLYDEFYFLINKYTGNIIKKIDVIKDTIVYSVITVIFLLYIPSKDSEIKISKTKYPYRAIEFVKINDLKGNLFINFDWGSYAAYKLYPNNLIVMDGRYEEVYNPELLKEMKNFHLVTGDWYKIIRENKTDIIIIEKEYPVYEELLKNDEFSICYEDKKAAVFLRDPKKDYIMPNANPEYYDKMMFETNIKFMKDKK